MLNGELFLGWNILIGYMLWEGYNFEDVVFVSECLVFDDVFILIYIGCYEIFIVCLCEG